MQPERVRAHRPRNIAGGSDVAGSAWSAARHQTVARRPARCAPGQLRLRPATAYFAGIGAHRLRSSAIQGLSPPATAETIRLSGPGYGQAATGSARRSQRTTISGPPSPVHPGAIAACARSSGDRAMAFPKGINEAMRRTRGIYHILSISGLAHGARRRHHRGSALVRGGLRAGTGARRCGDHGQGLGGAGRGCWSRPPPTSSSPAPTSPPQRSMHHARGGAARRRCSIARALTLRTLAISPRSPSLWPSHPRACSARASRCRSPPLWRWSLATSRCVRCGGTARPPIRQSDPCRRFLTRKFLLAAGGLAP